MMKHKHQMFCSVFIMLAITAIVFLGLISVIRLCSVVSGSMEPNLPILFGFLLIVIGIASQTISHTFGGTATKDFFSGLLLGLSIGEMLIGIYVVGRSIANK